MHIYLIYDSCVPNGVYNPEIRYRKRLGRIGTVADDRPAFTTPASKPVFSSSSAICLSIDQSIDRSIYLSIYLSIYIYLLFFLSIYLSM